MPREKTKLFEELNTATSVVEVEKVFKKFDSELTVKKKADLLLECSNLEYNDFDTLTDDADRYVREVTSFLSKGIQVEDLYKKYI